MGLLSGTTTQSFGSQLDQDKIDVRPSLRHDHRSRLPESISANKKIPLRRPGHIYEGMPNNS